LLAGLPDSHWRRQQELALQTALQLALAATKGYSAIEVGETITRSRALAEQIEQPQSLAMLIGSEWAFHSFRAEHRLALSRAEHIEKLGKTLGVGVQLLGRRLHGLTCFYLGEFMASRTLLERSLGLSDPAHRLGPALSEDPYAVVLAHLAVTLAHLGYIDQARSRLNEAELEARRLKHANTLAIEP
jgi:hypothetical protein